MMKTQETSIDGMRFRCTQMSGMRGFLLTNDLLQLAAPMLGQLGSLKPGAKLGELPLGEVANALAAALPNLTRERQEQLTRELLEQCVVVRNGAQQPVLDVFDELFQGAALTAYKLLAFSLKVNFASFFAALGSVGIGRPTPTPSSSETSSISAGPPSA